MDQNPKIFRFASPKIVNGSPEERYIIRSDGVKGHFYFPPDDTNFLMCEDKTCPGKALAIDGTELGEVKLVKKHKKNCLSCCANFDATMMSSVVLGDRETPDWVTQNVRLMPDDLKNKMQIHINVSSFFCHNITS